MVSECPGADRSRRLAASPVLIQIVSGRFNIPILSSNVANFVMSSCIAHSWLHSKSIRRAQPFTTQVENMAGNSTTQNGQASKSDDAQLKAICTHFSSLELKFCLISVELTMVCMREDLLASRYKIDNRMLHYCCFVNKCRDTLFRGNGKCVLLDV